jgi:hypothetical protein
VNEERFPYEKSKWNNNEPEKQRRWNEALELTGVESARLRLAQNDAGSGGAISIGTENITKGFVEEWVAWNDRRKSEREERFRRRQIFWTRWAACAASVAATAAAIGWLWTLWVKR